MARRGGRSKGRNGQSVGWMLLGLSLGLAVAVGVYVSGARVDGGRQAAAPAALRTPPREAPGPVGPQRTASPGTAPAGTREESDDRFEFYEILPRYEVVVPEVESVTEPSAPPAPVAAPGSYVLQAGSFRSMSDADRMQASLALLGIESRIQRVTIDDDVFHRVRVGPIDDLDQLNRLRAQLRGAGIDSLTMKVNE